MFRCYLVSLKVCVPAVIFKLNNSTLTKAGADGQVNDSLIHTQTS